jgi:dienelactone hydrolase
MTKRLLVPALLALLVNSAAGQAPSKALPGDAMIEKYLAAKADELSKRELDGAKTQAEWEQRLPRLRREYFYMLGLWPLPEKTPLKATVTGTLEHEGVFIEKIHFQSRPGLYVTGNLYRPREIKGKLPAILYVCGHSDRGRDGNKSAYQDHGMWFGANGYICLVLDSLQLGEIRGIHHGTYRYGRWWWQAAGYTPAGVECWNGIRAIDYLLSRPDVDAERIGVTGISGGGAATFWIAAADERVKCAVPVSGMSDLESYVKHKVIDGHCDCMFLYNTYQWDWTTIAALIAPRPLLFANSDNDKIFPMDGNRRVIAKLRKLYQMYGKPELVDEYVSQGGHAYRPDLRVAVFKWINKFVKNDTTTPVKDVDFKPIPGKDLRVFPEDKDVPADQINTKVDEVFVPRAQVKLPKAGDWPAWKKRMLDDLREYAFRDLPLIVPPARMVLSEYGGALQTWTTEPNVQILCHSNDWGPIDACLLVNRNGAAQFNPRAELAKSKTWNKEFWKTVRGANTLSCVLYLRGDIGAPWTRKSPPNYVERSHPLLGTSVDLGRVRDIIAFVRGEPKREWKVIGAGEEGIVAAYAALFEPAIKEVVVINPPTSHVQGPIFLNVLRVLEIPEALGLLAPTRLTLINAKDQAFDRTEELYRLAGAADKLKRQ